jgi:two-component system, LytTR family, sensor kinase
MLTQLSTNRFVRHLLFWAGVNLFFFIGFYSQPEVYKGDPSPFNPVFFLAELLFSSLVSFLFYAYILVYGLLPLAFRRSYGWFAVGLLGLNIMTSLVYEVLGYEKSLLLHWIGYDSSPFVNTIEFTNPFISPIFFESNLVAGLMVGIQLLSRWYQKQQESQRLEREKIQTELQLLKLQLNPDFLFSSLNQLATLTLQKSKYAPEMILKLAHLLRYVLYESQAERVPLAREVAMIEHYVFLQRIIHPTNLEVSFTVRGHTEEHSIAPSSLFPIVENAFHQLPVEQPDEPAWVNIDLAINETHLTLKVINGQSVTQTDNSNQLAGIQKQLYFHYADEYDLQILSETDAFIVILTLPLTTTSELGPVQTALLTRP